MENRAEEIEYSGDGEEERERESFMGRLCGHLNFLSNEFCVR